MTSSVTLHAMSALTFFEAAIFKSALLDTKSQRLHSEVPHQTQRGHTQDELQIVNNELKHVGEHRWKDITLHPHTHAH